MRRFTMIATIMMLVLGAAALPALAQDNAQDKTQDKATELTAGVIGFGYTTCEDCKGVLEIATGGTHSGRYVGMTGGTFAIGFYTSPGVAIEPSLGFNRLSSDGDALSVLNLGLAVPIYPGKGWGHKGHYFAPRVTYNRISGGGDSASQITVGLALGSKARLNDMAAFRTQAFFDYGFKDEDGHLPSTMTFGMLFGLSAYVD